MKSKFYPRRTFIADQIDNECPNKTSLYYQLPFQKVSILCINSSDVVLTILGLFSRLEYSETSLGSSIRQSRSLLLFENESCCCCCLDSI